MKTPNPGDLVTVTDSFGITRTGTVEALLSCQFIYYCTISDKARGLIHFAFYRDTWELL